MALWLVCWTLDQAVQAQALATRGTVLCYWKRHFTRTGLKITAGQWTMSGPNDDLSGQNFGLAVILTGHVHGFQINSTKNLFAVFLEILQ